MRGASVLLYMRDVDATHKMVCRLGWSAALGRREVYLTQSTTVLSAYCETGKYYPSERFV